LKQLAKQARSKESPAIRKKQNKVFLESLFGSPELRLSSRDRNNRFMVAVFQMKSESIECRVSESLFYPQILIFLKKPLQTGALITKMDLPLHYA